MWQSLFFWSLIIIGIIIWRRRRNRNQPKSEFEQFNDWIFQQQQANQDAVPQPDNFDRLNSKYRKRFNFLTPSEKRYFKQLLAECAANNQLVFAKVRLEDLVYIPKGMEWSDYQSMRGFVKSRHIDFVVTDMECNVLYCVELDDPSHQRPDRQERDRKINQIMAMAGIELKRIS